MFYSILFVYSYLCYVKLFDCPLGVEGGWRGIQVTQEANFHFVHLL